MCSLQILNPSTKQKLQMWSLKKAFIDLFLGRPQQSHLTHFSPVFYFRGYRNGLLG